MLSFGLFSNHMVNVKMCGLLLSIFASQEMRRRHSYLAASSMPFPGLFTAWMIYRSVNKTVVRQTCGHLLCLPILQLIPNRVNNAEESKSVSTFQLKNKSLFLSPNICVGIVSQKSIIFLASHYIFKGGAVVSIHFIMVEWIRINQPTLVWQQICMRLDIQ